MAETEQVKWGKMIDVPPAGANIKVVESGGQPSQDKIITYNDASPADMYLQFNTRNGAVYYKRKKLNEPVKKRQSAGLRNHITLLCHRDCKIMLPLTETSKEVLDNMMTDLIQKISVETGKIAKYAKQTSVTYRDVKSAAQIILPPNLFNECMAHSVVYRKNDTKDLVGADKHAYFCEKMFVKHPDFTTLKIDKKRYPALVEFMQNKVVDEAILITQEYARTNASTLIKTEDEVYLDYGNNYYLRLTYPWNKQTSFLRIEKSLFSNQCKSYKNVSVKNEKRTASEPAYVRDLAIGNRKQMSVPKEKKEQINKCIKVDIDSDYRVDDNPALRTGTWYLVPCYHRDIPFEMLRKMMITELGTGHKGQKFHSIAQDAVDMVNEVVNHVVMLLLEDTADILKRFGKKTIVPKFIKNAICDDEDFEKLFRHVDIRDAGSKHQVVASISVWCGAKSRFANLKSFLNSATLYSDFKTLIKALGVDVIPKTKDEFMSLLEQRRSRYNINEMQEVVDHINLFYILGTSLRLNTATPRSFCTTYALKQIYKEFGHIQTDNFEEQFRKFKETPSERQFEKEDLKIFEEQIKLYCQYVMPRRKREEENTRAKIKVVEEEITEEQEDQENEEAEPSDEGGEEEDKVDRREDYLSSRIRHERDARKKRMAANEAQPAAKAKTTKAKTTKAKTAKAKRTEAEPQAEAPPVEATRRPSGRTTHTPGQYINKRAEEEVFDGSEVDSKIAETTVSTHRSTPFFTKSFMPNITDIRVRNARVTLRTQNGILFLKRIEDEERVTNTSNKSLFPPEKSCSASMMWQEYPPSLRDKAAEWSSKRKMYSNISVPTYEDLVKFLSADQIALSRPEPGVYTVLHISGPTRETPGYCGVVVLQNEESGRLSVIGNPIA